MAKIYKPNLKKVLYLNSTNASITQAGSKNVLYSWNIPEININELGELQIASISSIGAVANAIYTFRLYNLATNNNNSYASDGGMPILFSLTLNNTNSMFRDDFGVYLMPQSINNITISVSDTITTKDAGIDDTVSFVICIVIVDNQIEVNDISNPLGDVMEEIKAKQKNYIRLN